MPVNWKLVRKEHVIQACELAAAGKLGSRLRGRGLFVIHDGKALPAKDVARASYLLAIGKAPDAYLDFSSGQSTLDMFTRLGFQVERRS
jgi:hypothetical protein